MAHRSTIRAASVTVLGLATCLVLWTWAGAHAAVPDPSGNQEKPVEQAYKNIQVLNGLPASELDGAMYYMSAALGVGCAHCHTNSWESDAKPSKLAARRMILMTRNINKENFSGNPVVNCYTCHRGQTQTVTMPPAVEPAWQALEAEPAGARPVEAMPAAEQVIERYIRAIGGEGAINKLRTRVALGTRTTANKMTPPLAAPLEVYQTAANKLLVITRRPGGVTYEGFNGTAGWAQDAGGLRRTAGKELVEEKRGADFIRFLKIKESYPGLRVLGKEKLGGREAYVVGATSREGDRERLYFDAGTGLLIRRYLTFRTALGSIPEVTDFWDYKEVDGIKLPFTVSWSRAPFTSTDKFADIKLNVAIEDAKFDPPASK
jgi:hypothetical protein